MPPAFRINARTFFLTYPQCDASKEDLNAHHVEKFKPLWIITAEETHEDGTPHLHCVLQFDNRKDIRDCNYFDYGRFHCNVQSARNAADVARYVTKGGKFCTSGETPLKKNWKTALESKTRTEFFDAVRGVSPRDYILSHERIVAYAEAVYSTSKPDYAGSWTQFTVPDDVKEWTETEFLNGRFGPTN